MLENILLAVAGIGLLGILYGRYVMIRDSGGDLPFLWILALRLIPFSELVYMVRHFSQAKTGGLIAIAGMWLMVPYAGVQLWEKQNRVKEFVESRQDEYARKMETFSDDELSAEELSLMPGESAVAFLHARDRKLIEKEKLVAQFNARLSWWHQQLQQRRATLSASDEAAVRDFNAEAAAYATLNGLAKEASAELLALRAVAKR